MLRFSATPPPPADWSVLAALPGLDEVLLEHELLARSGGLGDDALCTAASEARARGLRVILVWDVLASEQLLERGAALVDRLGVAHFDALRVQDPGVALFARERWPDWPLQLVLETGNHNLIGATAWRDALQPERLVLANELPASELTRFAAAIDCELEIAVLGRLLMFYSPRPLVRAAEGETLEEVRERFAIDPERRRHYPVIENRHGTFMFYEKDLNLLPWLSKVEACGLRRARLDFKYFPAELVTRVTNWLMSGDASELAAVKSCLSPRTTGGFFKSNRTDKQFTRLKNTYLRVREDRILLATVLETSRKTGYTVLHADAPLRIGMVFDYLVPEGEWGRHQVEWLRGLDGRRLEATDGPGVYLVNHARRASPGTKCYLPEDE